MENNEQKSIQLRHPETKILLEYDLYFVQAIFQSLRNETDSFAGSMLREYEHRQHQAIRLEEDRLQREAQERIKQHPDKKISEDIE